MRSGTVVSHDATSDDNTSTDDTGIGFWCGRGTCSRSWITSRIVIRSAAAALVVFTKTCGIGDGVWNVALVKGTREYQGSQRTLTETDQTSYVSTKKTQLLRLIIKYILLKEKLQQKYLILGNTTLITFSKEHQNL